MTLQTPVCSWIRHHVIQVLTSHQYASGSRCERLCACELSRGVIFERAHNDTRLSLTYLTIGIYQFRLSVGSGPSEELWMMKSCIITWFLSMRLVRWEGNQWTTSITLLITSDWSWCNQVSCLRWMPGCYSMYGDSSLVVIGESSFKIGPYFIYSDLQTLYTSKRI